MTSLILQNPYEFKKKKFVGFIEKLSNMNETSGIFNIFL